MNSLAPGVVGAEHAELVTVAPRRGMEIALSCPLFLAGVGISYYYGRVGYMPLDQSIVTEGGATRLADYVLGADFLRRCTAGTRDFGYFQVHALTEMCDLFR